MLKALTEYDSDKLLSRYVPVSKNKLVRSLKEIKNPKFPLALKIISPDALHKSEIKGVRIVKSKEELKKNFNDLIKISKKLKLRLEGILAQDYFEGQNFIIGIKKDETFSHVILFGIGGIFTEIVRDFSIRKCPIDLKEAQSMMDELKAKEIFHGFRNIKLNINLLKKVLVRVSQIPRKHPEIRELDINPFILDSKKGCVVDSRMIVG
ncbi:acetate--CoA ligase family protein [Candidatus Woesearchaeota archaeon]|nr:acetate--CoA ligase family protein [Candidatus Woesearchaeota archaeon]